MNNYYAQGTIVSTVDKTDKNPCSFPSDVLIGEVGDQEQFISAKKISQTEREVKKYQERHGGNLRFWP